MRQGFDPLRWKKVSVSSILSERTSSYTCLLYTSWRSLWSGDSVEGSERRVKGVNRVYELSLIHIFIKGTKKIIYFNDASIGEIPEHITENNIVVASSNNGAVQNIVNELPLSKEIDNFLIEELKEADYFCEILNTKVSVEWLEDENGKKREELVKESVPGEEKFWGVFSLEGGKANNMRNILTNICLLYTSRCV